MLAFFLIDWIVDYINTPEIQQTPAMAALYYTALAIWSALIISVVSLIVSLVRWLKEKWGK